MPQAALTAQEFAALAQQYPDLSKDELFAVANLHNDLKAKTFTPGAIPTPTAPGPSTTDSVLRTAARVVPAVAGGMVGALAGPVGAAAGGAVGAGAGEALGEWLETQSGDRAGFNPAQIATQTALGAIPIPGAGKGASALAKVAGGAGKGAVMGGASSAATSLAEGERPTLGGVGMGALMGGAMGGAVPALAEADWGKLLREETGSLKLPELLRHQPDQQAGFYSRVEKIAEGLPPKGVHPNKLKSLLQSGAAKEEIEYRKIPDFLAALGEKPVTPEALKAHLEANPFDIKVSRYGRAPKIDFDPAKVRIVEEAPTPYMDRSRTVHYGDEVVMRQTPQFLSPGSDVREYPPLSMEDLQKHLANRGMKRPKYTDWSLPGGLQKEETILKLPFTPLKPTIGAAQPFAGTGEARWHGRQPVNGVMEYPFKIGAEEGRITHWPETFDHMERPLGPKVVIDSPNIQNAQMASLEEAIQYLEAAGGDELRPSIRRHDIFTDHHYPEEKNILAHSRSDTRFTPDGKRGKLIDEVQSFPHQAARDHGGYRLPPEEYDALQKRYQEVYDRVNDAINTDSLDDEAFKALRVERNKLLDEVSQNHKRPPKMPFADAWPELVLKQQLLDAVNDDASFLALSPGDVQNARYGLEKKFSRIAYHPESGTLGAWDKSGKKIIDQNVSRDALPGVVGKELAAKLAESERVGAVGMPVQELIGKDLKTGGEPMRQFYDVGNVRRLDKILEKFGAKPGALGKIETTPKSGKEVRYTNPVEWRNEPQGFFEFNKRGKKGKQLASLWNPNGPRGPYASIDAFDDTFDHLLDLNDILTERSANNAGFKTTKAWKWDLTPEVKARIKKEGLPLLTLLGMLGLNTPDKEQPDANPALAKALLR